MIFVGKVIFFCDEIWIFIYRFYELVELYYWYDDFEELYNLVVLLEYKDYVDKLEKMMLKWLFVMVDVMFW